jgi:hypothetical protein
VEKPIQDPDSASSDSVVCISTMEPKIRGDDEKVCNRTENF